MEFPILNFESHSIIYLMPNVAIDDPLRVQIKEEWSKPVILSRRVSRLGVILVYKR